MSKNNEWTIGIYRLPDVDSLYEEYFRKHFKGSKVRLISPHERTGKFDIVVFPHFEGYDTTRAAFYTPKQIVPELYHLPNSLVKFMLEGMPEGGFDSDFDYYLHKASYVIAEGNSGCALVDYYEKGKLSLEGSSIVHHSKTPFIDFAGQPIYQGKTYDIINSIPRTELFARYVESRVQVLTKVFDGTDGEESAYIVV